jgi:hypothetical protein
MPSTFNRQILYLLLCVVVTNQYSRAQLAGETPKALPLRFALLNLSDTSNASIIWKPFDAVTMIKQTGNGILYGAGFGAGGALAGLALGALKPATNKDDFHVLTAAGIGLAVGAVIGVTLGVYNAGASDGGNGTIIGTILGTAATAIPVLLITSNSETAAGKSTGYNLAPFVLFIGPIVGYHISATPVYSSQNPDGHDQRMITPLFGQHSSGIQFSITF